MAKIFESTLEPGEPASLAGFFALLPKSEAATLSLLLANKELNERAHRQRDIRELVPYLIFGGDDDQQRRVLDGVSAFPQHLPFEYEEEKNSADRNNREQSSSDHRFGRPGRQWAGFRLYKL